MSLTVGARVGPYEVVAPIGAGGMGEVYRARDTTLQRDVALKILPVLFAHDPERLARFQREAQALASLNHPHIAQVYGFETAGDVRVLVMEFVPGETLEESKGLPVAEVLDLARQIADALEAAHEHGIVHRDLKPANIKVTPDGVVKVLDFGLAKLGQASGSGLPAPGVQAAGLTQSPTMASPAMVTGAGMLLGTAAYMAPEQARGKAIDKRADIWAFGCVLFELLSGKPVFEGETVTDVLSAVVSKEPEWRVLPASTPGHLRALIERCLVKEPRARLRDIGEARIALSLPLSAQAPASPTSKIASSWRERAAWAMAALAVLVAIGALRRPAGPTASTEGAMQLSVDLPPGMALANNANPLLSPDGTVVAIRASEGFGTSLLWLTDLRLGGSPRRVPGTEEVVSGVWWSPDGSELAFFDTSRGIRALNVASGAVRTICSAPCPGSSRLVAASGTWSRHGDILFGGQQSGLYRVPAAGGVPTPVTSLEPGHTGHNRPTFLPNGRTFVYSVSRRPGPADDAELWIGSLESDDRSSIGKGASAIFVAPDWLLFFKGLQLFAQRVDLDRRTLRDSAVAVPVQVGMFGAASLYSATADVLVFRAPVPDQPRRLAWYDRAGQRVGEITVPDNTQGVEIAPDGSRAVFEVFEAGLSSRDLWVAAFATGATQKVAFTDADEADAKWMPDSRTLVFGPRRDGVGSLARLVLNSTEPVTPLEGFDLEAAQYPTSMSRDGSILTFMSGGQAFWARLPAAQSGALLAIGAGTPRQRVSPDGRWLLYENITAGRREVYLEPLPPTGARWPVSREGGTWARWHPNGREVYFISPDNTMMAASFHAAPTVSLSPPARLFQTRMASPTRSGVHANYDVAPDGRFLIAENIGPDQLSSSLRVIVNWQSLLPQAR